MNAKQLEVQRRQQATFQRQTTLKNNYDLKTERNRAAAIASLENKRQQYYDEEESYYSMNSEDRLEEEYVLFLDEFGQIDFTNLEFLPKIRTVVELKEIKKEEIMNTTRMIRQNILLAQAPGYPVKYKKYSEDKGKYLLHELKVGKRKPGEAEKEEIILRRAERFDFTYQDVFYALNFKIDEFGERITSTSSTEFSRIISKNGISRPEESIDDEEIFDEFGN